MSPTRGAPRRTGRRHRIVAIGLGFGGLTAAKMLKHAEMNITDALVFLTRFTAQGISRVAHQTSCWHQAIPAIAITTTTFGALIALYLGVVRKRAFHRAETRHNAVISEPKRADMQWQMCAGANDIIAAPRDALGHKDLRRSRRTAKGWS